MPINKFLKSNEEWVRELAPTHTAAQIAAKITISTKKIYDIVKGNPEIILKIGKRGRPNKF